VETGSRCLVVQEAVVDFERALLMWWNNLANCVVAEQCIDPARST